MFADKNAKIRKILRAKLLALQIRKLDNIKYTKGFNHIFKV
jgi:hypothetical protein